ncbi:hypothetical protein L6164_005275 [Bauhinia variegata]|uniref:Uncharacterized protein n=1 Tax=Bauhinia variegata TaxID=167791 RepID=A0ACB9PQT8_BAUVA|nr:hypothetical protein L6164_005275 [Bauhinia variegata]
MASELPSKLSVSISPKSESSNASNPKGQCLCSPTTHEGSFRCRFHRAKSSSAWMKRSNSMPTNDNTVSKSVESAS